MRKSVKLRILAAALAVGCVWQGAGKVEAAASLEPAELQNYVAFAVGGAGQPASGDTWTIEGTGVTFKKKAYGGKEYWVRQGYELQEVTNKHHDGVPNGFDKVMMPYRTGEHVVEHDKNLALVNRFATTVTDDKTVIGESLSIISTSMYGGVSNTDGVATPSSFNYYIDANADGKFVDVGGTKLGNYFVTVDAADGLLTWNDTKQTYMFKDRPVPFEHVYIIGDQTGVFTVNNKKEVYSGPVYGHHNEILVTAYSKDTEKWHTIWASEVSDPTASISTLTRGDFNEILRGIHMEDVILSRADVKQAEVDGNSVKLVNSGVGEEKATLATINFANKTGLAAGENQKIVVSAEANTTNVIELEAGSRVEGTVTDGKLSNLNINGVNHSLLTVTGTKDSAGNLTKINIDGEDYQVVDTNDYTTQGTYDPTSKKITFNRVGGGTYDVDLTNIVAGGTMSSWKAKAGAKEVTIGNNDTLEFAAGANVELALDDTNKLTISATNTTLVPGATKSLNEDGITNTYTFKDTANNTVIIDDVASANKVKQINTQVASNTTEISNLNTTVAGHITQIEENKNNIIKAKTEVQAGTNVTVNESTASDGHTIYTVNVTGVASAGDVTNLQGEVINGGTFSNGTLTLQKAGNDPANPDSPQNITVTGFADYALDKGADLGGGKTGYSVDNNGQITMVVKDKYGTDSYNVTLDNIAKASDLGNVNNIVDNLFNDGEAHTVVNAINNLNKTVTNNGITGGSIDHSTGQVVLNKQNGGNINIGTLRDFALANGSEEIGRDAADAPITGYKADNDGVVTMKVVNKYYQEGSDEPKEYEVKIGDVASKTVQNQLVEAVNKLDGEVIDGGSFDNGTLTLHKAGNDPNDDTSPQNITVTGFADYALQNGDADLKDVNDNNIKGYKADTAGNITLTVKDRYGDSTEQVVLGDVASKAQQDVNIQNIANNATNIATNTTNIATNTTNIAINKEHIENNAYNIAQNTQRINALGDRVNKVGAGAAALAALHPMDFDPDEKLTFAAGYGNYKGSNSAALGAFYRPTEKVMFSLGGTMGNDNNMVNVGVSFALDGKSNVNNSKVAMAKEIVELRKLAVENARQMAESAREIEELKALVNKLLGHNAAPAASGYDPTKAMFEDVPENHWAYEYVNKLAQQGVLEGYPDGSFGGERTMTRYEFAAMLFRAMNKGVELEPRLLQEFEHELGRIRVDRIKGGEGVPGKIERVRVVEAPDRDVYGSKLAVG